jgi:hypothetical protein
LYLVEWAEERKLSGEEVDRQGGIERKRGEVTE